MERTLTHIEQALVDASNPKRHGSPPATPPIAHPTHLEALPVSDIRFDEFYDAGLIEEAVGMDFSTAYKEHDVQSAEKRRTVCLGWLDWLTSATSLQLSSAVYLNAAVHASVNGDAGTVEKIISAPQRLWYCPYNKAIAEDGSLDFRRLPISLVGDKALNVSHIVRYAQPGAEASIDAVVTPILTGVVGLYSVQDTTLMPYRVESVASELMACMRPPMTQLAHALVDAFPATVAKLDVLTLLAKRYRDFTPQAIESRSWFAQRSDMAYHWLSEHLSAYADWRDVLDLPRVEAFGQDGADPVVVAQIVDHIERRNGVSDIETAVAYVAHSSYAGAIDGEVLSAARVVTGNPALQFEQPQFGFSVRSGESGVLRKMVTVVDPSLPAGGMELNFSDPELNLLSYDATRMLCSYIQSERSRRGLKD